VDLDDVYDLIVSSEDPESLRIFGFTKKDLGTPFLMRIFRFVTQKKLVAVLGNRIAEHGIEKIRVTVPTAKPRLTETVRELGFKEMIVMDAMAKELQ
jgi:hypothetical protein